MLNKSVVNLTYSEYIWLIDWLNSVLLVYCVNFGVLGKKNCVNFSVKALKVSGTGGFRVENPHPILSPR